MGRRRPREVLLVVLGVALHSLYMLSIFDIYFKSPIVSGMEPEPLGIQPPANRLVLFIGGPAGWVLSLPLHFLTWANFRLREEGPRWGPFLVSVRPYSWGGVLELIIGAIEGGDECACSRARLCVVGLSTKMPLCVESS